MSSSIHSFDASMGACEIRIDHGQSISTRNVAKSGSDAECGASRGTECSSRCDSEKQGVSLPLNRARPRRPIARWRRASYGQRASQTQCAHLHGGLAKGRTLACAQVGNRCNFTSSQPKPHSPRSLPQDVACVCRQVLRALADQNEPRVRSARGVAGRPDGMR